MEEISGKDDIRYMKQAITQAKKARANQDVPIGCVIVYEGKVIARGYNRRNADKTTLAHAEILAIRKASKVLGDCIQKSIVQLLQPENTRVNKQATSSTYLLYNATVPAVLVECGFLSNSAELKRLKDEEYQKKMAFSIFCGITSFYSEGNL